MARTTLDLDEGVLRELRRRGSKEGKSMGRLASELLAPTLAESVERRGAAPLAWTSRELGTPRVDLEDKEAVRAVLDKRQ